VDANGQVVRSEQPDRALPPIDEGDWVIVRRDIFTVPSRTPPGQYTLEVAVADASGSTLRREDQPGMSVPITTVRVNAR
jgi:hypothetical protein